MNMLRKMITRVIEWGKKDVHAPINEDIRHAKMNQLFRRDVIGQTPSPWFMI